MRTIGTLLGLVCLFYVGVVRAQDRARMATSMSDKTILARAANDPTYIPAGSRVYVADIQGLPGFENNLVAAFQKKRVDLLVVAYRAQADFEIKGFARSRDPNWAKIIFSSGLPESEASIQLVNLKSGVVAYAVASYKVHSPDGNKSTAEHLAKNLRQKMERDDKRIR